MGVFWVSKQTLVKAGSFLKVLVKAFKPVQIKLEKPGNKDTSIV